MARNPIEMTRSHFGVVVPVLNQEEHIDQCIASIFSQNAGHRIALHLQDGGSRDQTLGIIEKWSDVSNRFPNISFSFESAPDSGVPEALNRGFSLIEADFYTWLGADDFLFPWATAVVSGVSSALPEFEWFTGVPTHVNVETVPLALAGETGISAPPSGYSQRMLSRGLMSGGLFAPMIQQEGTFWSHRAFQNIRKSISTEWALAFDYDLWVRLASGDALLQLAIPLGAFRRRPGQLSATQKMTYWNQVGKIKEVVRQAKKDKARGFSNGRKYSSIRHIAYYDAANRVWIYRQHRFRAFALLRAAQKIHMALRYLRR